MPDRDPAVTNFMMLRARLAAADTHLARSADNIASATDLALRVRVQQLHEDCLGLLQEVKIAEEQQVKPDKTPHPWRYPK